MMVASVRIDGCANHINKKLNLLLKKYKIISPEEIIPKIEIYYSDCGRN